MINTGCHDVIRDYHKGFLLSPTVSTPDPIIRPESFSSRADNGRGLILRMTTKNLFITYLYRYFE